jgi:hypothetical protein
MNPHDFCEGQPEFALQTVLKNSTKFAGPVARHYDAEIFLYSGMISEPNYGRLVQELSKPRSRPNGLLIVATNGGYANPAFKIARLMQTTFRQVLLYVPRECYSAGTLLALAAHRLIVDDFAELGPLDVQLPKQNEIGGRKSGLVSRSAFESLGEISFALFEKFMLQIKGKSDGTVSFEMASRIASQMAVQLVAPVLAKIDPDVIGSDHRDLNVAIEYGRRLAEIGGNVKPGTVDHLVSAYPSHDFIVDEKEARSLFRATERPVPELYKLVASVAQIAYSEARPAVIAKLEVPSAKARRTRSAAKSGTKGGSAALPGPRRRG